jgi:tRNA(fMet)-specific endonuclease VapC
MYLLDTDTLSKAHAGNANVAERLRTLEDPVIGITIVTKIEMLRGRMDYVLKAETSSDLLRAQGLLERTESRLAALLIIPFDTKAAEQFERLQAVSKLRKIGRADLLIASIALANQAVLVTRNLRHFRQFPGLTVVNWVD